MLKEFTIYAAYHQILYIQDFKGPSSMRRGTRMVGTTWRDTAEKLGITLPVSLVRQTDKV